MVHPRTTAKCHFWLLLGLLSQQISVTLPPTSGGAPLIVLSDQTPLLLKTLDMGLICYTNDIKEICPTTPQSLNADGALFICVYICFILTFCLPNGRFFFLIQNLADEFESLFVRGVAGNSLTCITIFHRLISNCKHEIPTPNLGTCILEWTGKAVSWLPGEFVKPQTCALCAN